MNLLAADEIKNPVLGPNLSGLSGAGFFSALLPKLVILVFIVGGLVFFFMLVTGAISWITSGGEKQSLENARSKITNGLIGIVILFVAFAVIQFIERFFGIKILTIDIGSLTI